MNLLFAISAFYRDYSYDLMQNGIAHLHSVLAVEKFSIVRYAKEGLVKIYLGDISFYLQHSNDVDWTVVDAISLPKTLCDFAFSTGVSKFTFINYKTNEEVLKFSSIKINGSLELPQVVSFALNSKEKFDGVIAMGVVKKGKTSHDYFVSSECHRGLSDLSLKHGISITTAIINSDDDKIIKERVSETGYNVGKQAVQTCLELITIKQELSK